ncbi:TPA: head-tail adaptor protein [Vibrio parahaemolyticus]|nr:head-tail adaptor protein [Vibrio parahaemolyticus]
MRRGSLRHRLEYYLPDTYDIGNEVETWKLVGKPYASVRAIETLESVGKDHQVVELVEFTIPYSRALDFDYTDSIIVHRGREYDVQGIKNVGYMDKELKVLAKRYEGAKRVT